MKKFYSFLLLIITVSVVAAVASYLTISLNQNCKMCIAAASAPTHDWLHSQLNLTPEQITSLETLEEQHALQRKSLEERLLLANRELAEVILAEKQNSPRVHAAIEKIHHDMGELQKATIAHVFEMQKFLSPEQYEKLLLLTANALYSLNSTHGDK